MATLIMIFISIYPGERGAMTQLLYIEKTGQTSELKKRTVSLSISCLPYASNSGKVPCVAKNPVFIIKDPDNTGSGLRVAPFTWLQLSYAVGRLASCHSCCLPPCSLLRSFPPLFSDTLPKVLLPFRNHFQFSPLKGGQGEQLGWRARLTG